MNTPNDLEDANNSADDAASEGVVLETDDAELDEVVELRDALAAARAECDSLKDKWLRAVADFENYKKRVKRDTDDAVQRTLQSVVDDFVPVADNLDRAMSAMTGASDQVMTGLRMVKTLFTNSLGKHGITSVPGVGSQFDPAMHEALQQVKSEEFAPGAVVMVFESGYLRNGRLLRPAKVIVASDESTGVAATEES